MNRTKSLIVALVLLAGALAVGIPMGRWNDAHRQKYSYAFPDLQNAREVARAKEILRTWQWSHGTDDVRRAMQLDLLFPLFYAPLLALLAMRGSLQRPTPWVARLGRIVAFAVLLGGLADLGENATMLRMLAKNDAARLPLMIAFTYAKLAGIFAAIVYLLFSHLDSSRREVAEVVNSLNAPDAIASDVLPDR